MANHYEQTPDEIQPLDLRFPEDELDAQAHPLTGFIEDRVEMHEPSDHERTTPATPEARF